MDTNSMNILKEHIHHLHTYGLNTIRYLLNWSYLEPEPYKYNEEALNDIQELMNLCVSENIYVYLDMHQDLYSAFTDIEKADLTALHSNGAPVWTCVTNGKKIRQSSGIAWI